MRPVDFDVYRSDARDGKYEQIGTTEVPGCQYLDGDVGKGKTYFYRVKCKTRADDKRGGAPVRASDYGEPVSIRIP
jgi:hypothetical protein